MLPPLRKICQLLPEQLCTPQSFDVSVNSQFFGHLKKVKKEHQSLSESLHM